MRTELILRNFWKQNDKNQIELVRGIDLVLIFLFSACGRTRRSSTTKIRFNFYISSTFKPTTIMQTIRFTSYRRTGSSSTISSTRTQEVIQTLVHIPEQVELLQLFPQVLKHPPEQLVKHQPSHEGVGP